MKRAALVFLLILAFVLPGCSGNRAAELYETAGFEELQNNTEHALKLYREIVEKYPNSQYAKRAEERISVIEKDRMRK
jgi:outer membrane protein assembly factor BamD (BamD/ComL family)